MSAVTPGYNRDVLSELAEKYERSKVFLQELEQSLQTNLKADRGETTPATTEQGASATANRTSGIKSKVVDFFSGATFKGNNFKGAAASSSPRAPVPEVDGVEVEALRRPSVINLALNQLDVEAELVPVRRATSFQTVRRASVALVPSIALARQPSNGVASPSTQANARPPQRQQEDSSDNRRSTCNGLPHNPPLLRRAKTEQARLAQSVRWSLAFAENQSLWSFSDASGRRAAFLQSPCTSSTGDEPAQVHDFITPPLNSALYTSHPPETTLPPGRENSMRHRSHSRRGSEQDSVFAAGSDAGVPRRLLAPPGSSLPRSPSVSQLPALPSPRRQSNTLVPSVPSNLMTATRSTGGGTPRVRKAWQATPQLIMTSMPSLEVGGDGSDDGSAEADGEGSTGDVDVAALLSSCLYSSGSISGLEHRARSLADSGERPPASPLTTQGVGSLSAADAQAAYGCLAQMELPRKSRSLRPTSGVPHEGGL